MAVLIVTRDVDLARQLVEAVPGERQMLMSNEWPERETDDDTLPSVTDSRAAQELRATRGQEWLRHNVYESRPVLVLLDVQFGGQLYRAAASVPRILESGALVTLITPYESEAAEAAADDMGCDLICRASSDFLPLVVEAVQSARRHPSRASQARAPSRRQMH